jgi:hypothetical protein
VLGDVDRETDAVAVELLYLRGHRIIQPDTSLVTGVRPSPPLCCTARIPLSAVRGGAERACPPPRQHTEAPEPVPTATRGACPQPNRRAEPPGPVPAPTAPEAPKPRGLSPPRRRGACPQPNRALKPARPPPAAHGAPKPPGPVPCGGTTCRRPVQRPRSSRDRQRDRPPRGASWTGCRIGEALAVAVTQGTWENRGGSPTRCGREDSNLQGR